MKSIVETATGVKLNNDDHYVSIKIPKDCDLTEFKKQLINASPQQETLCMDEIEGTDGHKWLMFSLTKGLEGKTHFETETDKMIAQYKKFFEKVNGDTFMELYLKSSHSFTDCNEAAKEDLKKQNSCDIDYPSIAT